ncbi:hypothetical protein MNBD_GAMMA25-102 [hydrothermal vent metagenome]|uniref:Cytochrome c-552/4 domain-containing protein n=1 Tax=hydrothermal vent metagenome TaxID=652676 RepID=A0A3B1BWK9_9ZZZZ
MIRSMMLVTLFLCGMSNLSATPLYLDLLDNAHPDKKELDTARKQIKEHVETKLKNKLFITPFHKREVQETVKIKPICSLCHLHLPHQKNERSRSFLNMHSQYIACETCHLKTEGYSLKYRWLDFKAKEKEPQSTGIQKDNKEYKSIQSKPGLRITPFYLDEPVIVFSEHNYSRKLVKSWEAASNNDKVKIKAHLHSIIKKDGTKCKACHGKKDLLLDYSLLGATEKQVKAIEENIIAKFFARFRKDDEKIRITDLLR